MGQTSSTDIQMRFYRSGDKAAKLLPVSYEEWEERAKEELGAGPYGYVNGAAGAGDTMRANRTAFDKWRIVPRVCCDVSDRDLRVQLLGQELQFPFLLAPIGVNSILHPDGELAPARAAAKAGVPYILSQVSFHPMEKVAEAMGDAIRWFQMYPPIDRDLTTSFMQRAEKAGFSAIVVTLDSTMLGWREEDLRNGYLPFLSGDGLANYFTDPVFRSKLKEPPEKDRDAAVQKALDEGNNTRLTWQDIEFICKQTNLPVLLKGLTHPEDAVMALQHGARGVIVSNHGGRQLDGAIATLDALPAVMEVVRGRAPVLLDSGIRRGADMIKALALGADAVLLGRPYAYGLAVAGQSGVYEVILDMIAQLELQMAISGRRTVHELDRRILVRADAH